MYNVNSDFVSNILTTCTNERFIREDGKNLTLINRIIDFFKKIHKYDHFEKACKKLSELTNQSTILTPEEKAIILGRFRQIQKKIINNDIKNKCDNYLQKFESEFLKEDDFKEITQSIFQNMQKNIKSCNNKKINRDCLKLNAVISYYKENKKAIKELGNLFKENLPCCNKDNLICKELKKYFTSTNNFILKKQLDIEEKLILESNENSQNCDYENYPQLLRSYLENQFENPNKNDISHRISTLKKIMDKHKDNHEFIQNCLISINYFFEDKIFGSKTSMFVSELNKNKLLEYKELFTIFDRHLLSIQDHDLRLNLKIKFANLPCPSDRSNFPNLYLTEKEKLEILIKSLQSKEDEKIDSLIKFLEENKNPSNSDVHRLAKIVSSEGLSKNNREKIIEALKKRLNDRLPKSWENFVDVHTHLKELFLLNPGNTDLINSLKRISKGKIFFQNQLGLDEEMIHIPHWYHATHQQNILGILMSEKIEVRHQRTFGGAWVSSHREEECCGPYVLTFSNKIEKIDPNVAIRFQFPDKRWRGLQKPIPLNSSNLILIGFPSQMDKTAQKTDKLHLTTILKEKGFPNPLALSTKQVDFIHEEVLKTLGVPNLSDKWWGKGLAYSEYQLNLHSTIRSAKVDEEWFKNKNTPSDQLAIGNIIQSAALPLYKEAMPRCSSYRSEMKVSRVDLHRKEKTQYLEYVNKIKQNQVTARSIHGTMHCVRVSLWTQLFRSVYENLGREKLENPILLATTGAFHDVAREDEGIDYWDGESSEALAILLKQMNIDDTRAEDYVKAIKEKDPKNGQFSSDIQRIVHDADCIDIIRVIGIKRFKKKLLCFYHFDENKKEYFDQLIKEMADFIILTENLEVRNYLEHNSQDFYGDLVRVLFGLKRKNEARFPLITGILENEMQEIVKTETDSSKHILSLLQKF